MAIPIDKKILQGKIVLAGVGNILKGDDGFGPSLANEIAGKVSFKVFDTGMAPENYLGVIVKEKPDTIVFADTADFGGTPGDIRFLNSRDFTDSSFFLTHNTSFKLLFQFMEVEGLNANVFVLCIQPQSMVLGDDLSVEVENKVKHISHWFIDNY